MKSNKTFDELVIIDFEKAKKLYNDGHRFMAWWGYNESGEIVDYTEPDFKYPAPDSRYPSMQ